MKLISIILGIYSVINLILIILSGAGVITQNYLIFGGIYCVFFLIYQIIRREGLFSK